MSSRQLFVILAVLFLVVAATVMVKRSLQRLSESPVVETPTAISTERVPAEPEDRLEGAKRDLEKMRLELESSDFAEANISDTKARITEVQTRLDKLESESSGADPKSETFRFQIQQQQIDLQGDLERQIAELDSSIADLTRRGVDEEQINSLRAARDLVARRMETLYNDLQLRQMAASREQSEDSPAITDERKLLEGRLLDLRKELESWQQEENTTNNEKLKNLKDKITQQEELVRNLEMEVQSTQVR